jgi:DNA-binding transcriptional ArsR family regulator
MKRDMDLIREILLELESSPQTAMDTVVIDKRPPEEISYHLELLTDAGLIKAETYKTWDAPLKFHSIQLTWEGHEFLEAAKNETHWNRAKEVIKEKGSGLTFDILKALLLQLTRQTVGL